MSIGADTTLEAVRAVYSGAEGASTRWPRYRPATVIKDFIDWSLEAFQERRSLSSEIPISENTMGQP
jgi:hypothetical protein